MAGQQPTLEELAEWVKDTCLLFGAEPQTAYEVAGLFTKGLEREWEQKRETSVGEVKEESS